MKKIALLLALLMLCLTAAALGEEAAVSFDAAKTLYDEGKYAEAFPMLEALAAQDHPDALTYLGYLYEDGHSPSGIADYPTALSMYTKAADLGHANAMNAIGSGYYHGIFSGGTPDYALAYEWYSKSAELGNPYGAYAIGNMYYNAKLNDGVADYAKAYEYFTIAADAGRKEGLYYLGLMYQEGHHVAQDNAKAFEYFTASADLDFTYAMHELADGYKSGAFSNGTPDYDKAFAFYLQAAQKGHSCAPSHVEDMIKQGNLSLDSLTTAADAGYTNAMIALAAGWRTGLFNGSINFETALDWYLKADAAGHEKASHNVVDLLYQGAFLEDGTALFPSDHARMLAFLAEKYAAGTQDIYLLSWYGWLLCGNSEQGVCEADYPRACEVYKKAADLGDNYSMKQIADIHYNGDLGEADYAQAIKWYIKAEEAGHADLTSKIINLCEKGVVLDDGTVLLQPDHAMLLSYLEGLYSRDTQNVYALSWLGWLLCGYSEQGVCEADYHRAYEVFKKAADLGDGYSMWQIGRMYENGSLDQVDTVAAEAWYRKAVDAGNTNAQEALDALLSSQP